MMFIKLPGKVLPLGTEGVRERASLSGYPTAKWKLYQWRSEPETRSEDTLPHHSTCTAAVGRLDCPLTLRFLLLITRGFQGKLSPPFYGERSLQHPGDW